MNIILGFQTYLCNDLRVIGFMQMEADQGKKVSLVDVYIKTHERSDGSAIDKDSAEAMVQKYHPCSFPYFLENLNDVILPINQNSYSIYQPL